jgi:geranylgeranyl pyrophosphate synthase
VSAVPDETSVGDRIRDLVRAGGKRLRPSLTFHASRIFNADLERTVSVAAGIELLHTATLIHDDLVDNAQERRGVATLNSLFPLGLVVLSGDLLFAEAAQLVAEADHVGIVRAFARTLSEICNGELLQARTKHTLVPVDEYYTRIYGKTGSLFRAAAEAGAMLGTDDPAMVDAFSEYGRRLGMAFQIVDDALDFTSNSSQLGKPIGHDLREGVITLPVLLYHARHEHVNGTFNRVIAGTASQEQIDTTIDAIKDSGAVEEAMDIARGFAQQARDMLNHLPESEARHHLLNLTHFAVSREY